MFDVGDAIDLPQLAGRVDRTVASRLATKPPTPIYLQYQQPPLTFDASALGVGDVNGFPVRVKAFDYGVLSLAVTRPLPESWDEAFAAGLEWQDNAELAQAAERLCREMLSRIQPTVAAAARQLSQRRLRGLHRPPRERQRDGGAAAQPPRRTDRAVAARRTNAAQRAGARRSAAAPHFLSTQTDLVIPTWNGAFVYDTEAGAAGVLEILEFANSQLLRVPLLRPAARRASWRGSTRSCRRRGWRQTWLGRRYTRAARADARALHRRQRADRPDGERAEDRRRRLRGAPVRRWPPPGSASTTGRATSGRS